MNFHGCYFFVFIFDFKKIFSHMLPFLPPDNFRKPLFLWCIQKRKRKNFSLKRNIYFCRHFFCNVEKHDVSVIPELVIRKVSLKRNISFCRHFFCNVENHDVDIMPKLVILLVRVYLCLLAITSAYILVEVDLLSHKIIRSS